MTKIMDLTGPDSVVPGHFQRGDDNTRGVTGNGKQSEIPNVCIALLPGIGLPPDSSTPGRNRPAPTGSALARIALLACLLPCVLAPRAVLADLPILPGENPAIFGMDTVAGSGRHLSPPRTTVCKVDNLGDDGIATDRYAGDGVVSGDFRFCAERFSGPRTIVFEIGGTILLKQPVRIRSHATVAGQTAPPPGITFRDSGLLIERDTTDVLIEHVRIRVGDRLNYHWIRGQWENLGENTWRYKVPAGSGRPDEGYKNSVFQNYQPLTLNNGAGRRIGHNEYDFDPKSRYLYINVTQNPNEVRTGYSVAKSDSGDGIRVVDKPEFPSRIVLANVSVSWSSNININIGGQQTALIDSIISDGLESPLFPKKAHSKNVFVNGYAPAPSATRIAILRNLLSGSPDRNPEISGGQAVIANNYIHDTWQALEVFDDRCEGVNTRVSLSGNFVSTTNRLKYAPYIVAGRFDKDCDPDARIFIDDNNYWSGAVQTDPWNSQKSTSFEMRAALRKSRTAVPDINRAKSATEAIWIDNLVVRPAIEARDLVLARAGAYPAYRDAVDRGVVARAMAASTKGQNPPQTVAFDNEYCVAPGVPFTCCTDEGTGLCPDATWPAEPVVERALTLPDRFEELGPSGYTRLEEWLHRWRIAVETAPTNSLDDKIED